MTVQEPNKTHCKREMRAILTCYQATNHTTPSQTMIQTPSLSTSPQPRHNTICRNFQNLKDSKRQAQLAGKGTITETSLRRLPCHETLWQEVVHQRRPK